MIYTIYFEKTAGQFGDIEEAVIESSKSGKKTFIRLRSMIRNKDRGLEFLARDFVACGWRIAKEDRVQTISPIIVNELSSKPWDENSRIKDLINTGEMKLYRGLSPEELDRFYKTYLIELLDRGAQK